MTAVAVGSVKGAPGATTTALAIAAVWPAGRPLLVAELDPDGGVLAARRGLGFEPGLVGLAAALRRGTGDALAHTQPLNDAARVLVAPSTAEQVRLSIAAAGDALWPALRAACAGDVVVDCGRMSTASPAVGVAREADATAIVTRPRLEDVALARDRVPALRQAGIDPMIVLTDDGPYRAGEVAEAVGARVIARLPIDHRTANALNGLTAHHRLTRSRLLRGVRRLLEDLDAAVDRPDGPTPIADTSTWSGGTRATASPRHDRSDSSLTSAFGPGPAAR